MEPGEQIKTPAMAQLRLHTLELTPEEIAVTLHALVSYASSLRETKSHPWINELERSLYQQKLDAVEATLAKIDPKRFPK
jgi:predicted DNA-binding transcriptional regulator YafY